MEMYDSTDLEYSLVRRPLDQLVDRSQTAHGGHPRQVFFFVFQIIQHVERDPVVDVTGLRKAEYIVNQLYSVQRMYFFETIRVV